MQKSEDTYQVFHPWRRFFARTFDLIVYRILWLAFLAFVLHVDLIARTRFENILDSFAGLLIMLFIEPLLLHLFSTTPGKIIFGLRIISDRGDRLSYGEGLARTWEILGKGYGYNIPIYNLFRAWKSYIICSKHEVQPWDESVFYTIEDTRKFRAIVYIIAEISALAVIIVIFSVQWLPPNRGELTVAKFAENYLYYAKHYGIELGNSYLDDNGNWIEETADEAAFLIDAGVDPENKPEFHFMTDNGYIKEISFEVEEKDTAAVLLSSYETPMILSTLALVCAQDDVGLFSNIPNDTVNLFTNKLAQDGLFTVAGITVSWETEFNGFSDSPNGFLFSDEETPENSFALSFRAAKHLKN